MRALPCTLALALTLAACSGESKEEAAPGGSGARAVADAVTGGPVKPRPGLYRTTMKMLKFEVPGMPAGAAQQMQGIFAKTGNATETCITPEMAEKGYQDYSKNLAQGNCTMQQFDATGSNISARISCQVGQGMTSEIAMTGTVSPEQSTMNMKSEIKGPGGAGGPGTMRSEMEVTSQRVGDCPA